MIADTDLQAVDAAIDRVKDAVDALADALRADSSTFYLPDELGQLSAAVDTLASTVRRLQPVSAVADAVIPF
jgi:hypothetical protein